MVEKNQLQEYMVDLGRIPRLTPDEEATIFEAVRGGDAAARERLVLANLRLAFVVAHKNRRRGVAMEDLIQVGNEALMRAAKAFDPNRKLKFSTYAYSAIRHAITRICDQQGMSSIRIPGSTRRHAVAAGNPITTRAFSIDAGDPHTIQLRARLEDRRGLDGTFSEIDVKAVSYFVGDLLPVEREVVERRFGLGGRQREKLREIGDAMGVSRQRVQQIEAKALAKLRVWMERAGAV